MTNRHLARTLDAVANQRQVMAGVTTELRRSIGGTLKRWPTSKALLIASSGC